jgi:hypothetical protein
MIFPVEIFKSVMVAISGSVNRLFSATGRADETIIGKMYQHYGFRSSPPADTELATIKYGNNIISVAENDGNTPGKSAGAQIVSESNFEVGEVRIYSNGAFNNIILSPTPSVLPTFSININSDRGIYLNANDGKENVGIQASIVAVLSDPNHTAQALVTKAYSDAVTQWFTINAAALTSAGCTTFTAPLNSTTTVLVSE